MLITDLKQPILFIADQGREEEVVTRLSRVGYDHAIGFLKGGFTTWKQAGEEVSTIESISASTFGDRYANGLTNVVDVRRPAEYSPKHVKGASNVPLDYLNQHMDEFRKDTTYTLHCAGGFRSMIAASILQSRGYSVVNVEGGFREIQAQDITFLSEETMA